MADVNSPLGRGRASEDEDRAQIILITGLTLAVLFVAVVLLLNTVIYTQNLATRGADAGGAEAIEFREGVVDDLAGIMYREHRNRSSPDGVVDDFAASAATYARTVGDLRARDGVIADVSVNRSTVETGYFVAQNESDTGFRNMTSPGGSAADWTVAGNATRTRNYRLTVAPGSLSDSGGGAFTVVADGTTGGTNATWSAALWRATGDNLTVAVERETPNGTNAASETFAPRPDGNHTVDFTDGTVNGEPFDALVWAEGVQTGTDPYDVRYENGDEARGTYHLVVDDRDDGANPGRGSRPYVVEGIYSVEVEVLHRTPELTYRDVVRLAPGERDA
ncbi:DUF7261 family protein [Halorubrum sodomense]|uniref:Uncharacterized protein n=1 Tax=Halorubrum sodomense TaxID=35743 RepID=A0A1I6H6T1_HALSD|nr:hypothetical protein [Halorubrum sodomense]SFR50226.1 hypothetical protein SAMN04487937_2515 [Halorubrum sodomense]